MQDARLTCQQNMQDASAGNSKLGIHRMNMQVCKYASMQAENGTPGSFGRNVSRSGTGRLGKGG